MNEPEIQSTDGQERVQRITRRVFLRNMSVTAAAIVATACGGGGAESAATGVADASSTTLAPVSPTQQNPSAPAVETVAGGRAPIWNEIPTIAFTEGVAATFSIAAYVSDADSDALTILKNELALPPGVTYDPETKSFVYDGIGSTGMTSGHVLTAMEG